MLHKRSLKKKNKEKVVSFGWGWFGLFGGGFVGCFFFPIICPTVIITLAR